MCAITEVLLTWLGDWCGLVRQECRRDLHMAWDNVDGSEIRVDKGGVRTSFRYVSSWNDLNQSNKLHYFTTSIVYQGLLGEHRSVGLFFYKHSLSIAIVLTNLHLIENIHNISPSGGSIAPRSSILFWWIYWHLLKYHIFVDLLTPMFTLPKV